MPFEKGEKWNGNAKGRPKGSLGLSLSYMLKRKLEEVPEGEKRNYAELLIDTVLNKALIEKDFNSLKMLWNYIEGLPVAKQEILMNTNEIDDPSIRDRINKALNDYLDEQED